MLFSRDETARREVIYLFRAYLYHSSGNLIETPRYRLRPSLGGPAGIINLQLNFY